MSHGPYSQDRIARGTREHSACRYCGGAWPGDPLNEHGYHDFCWQHSESLRLLNEYAANQGTVTLRPREP